MMPAGTLADFLSRGRDFLRDRGVAEPRLNAEILLAHVLNIERPNLYLHLQDRVSVQQVKLFQRFLFRRGKREPIQYITGEVSFSRLSFQIRKGVFIPRPETEFLVREALQRITGGTKVLDVGTGCGAIGLTLARFSATAPDVEVTLLDKSKPAIMLAEENRKRLGLSPRQVKLAGAGFLFFVVRTKRKFGMVISNPPYIPVSEMERLPEEVKREPKGALFGGPDGLRFIRSLISGGYRILVKGGYLIFEIGYGQKEAVTDLVTRGGFILEAIIKDLAGIDRVVVCKK
ncbi:MAG: peptide chain release factor N(5)-glutamine methyltransferase [Candidatus Omnitrophota bacterium]